LGCSTQHIVLLERYKQLTVSLGPCVQVPLLIWIWYQREIGAEAVKAAAAAAGLVKAEGREDGDDE
jgi:hypothetical protein